MAKTGNQDAIWAIHKYKWYNWYMNIHIKPDSPEDLENTKIFEELEKQESEIHRQVESNITNFELPKWTTPDFDD